MARLNLVPRAYFYTAYPLCGFNFLPQMWCFGADPLDFKLSATPHCQLHLSPILWAFLYFTYWNYRASFRRRWASNPHLIQPGRIYIITWFLSSKYTGGQPIGFLTPSIPKTACGLQRLLCNQTSEITLTGAYGHGFLLEFPERFAPQIRKWRDGDVILSCLELPFTTIRQSQIIRSLQFVVYASLTRKTT